MAVPGAGAAVDGGVDGSIDTTTGLELGLAVDSDGLVVDIVGLDLELGVGHPQTS